MLTVLRIENFAIVKQLELDFANGMTAFTGETGAGKSIMIDALMLAMGGRADITVIRSGEEKCDISALFMVEPQSEPTAWLHEHDLANEGSEIVLRRVLYAEGRSKSYINGQPFPLNKVKELSELLVHIHGQHQHQTLMHHQTHRSQLDNYAGHDVLLDEVQALFKQWQSIKNELDTLSNHDKNRDRLELLQFQIDELSALALSEGEVQQLNQEHQLLHHANDYLKYTQQIMQLLNEDEQSTIEQQLNRILHLLSELPQNHATVINTAELINNALIQCQEAANELQQFAEKIQLDPERLAEVENRLSQLHHAARKYHVDVNQLSAYSLKLQTELQQIQQAEQAINHLQRQEKQVIEAYEQSALKLRIARTASAEKLAQEITAIIQQLGMPKGHISIEFTPLAKMHEHGLDKVEYKVCTNPGMAADTLNKIASGGELSRINLAIQMVTAQRGATPTLIFDEVDVGIGGATAALVGQLLRRLGERLQVFCVTHQSQVASAAHHHFRVEKSSNQQQTYTTITALDEQEKINELARMLGGLTITEQTLRHAKELLEQSS